MKSEKSMHTVEQSIEIKAPVEVVYNQWTQFEEFPHFMEGVEEVQQLGDKRLHFVAKVAGRRHEWDAEILEQIPEQKITWRSRYGRPNEGAVFFDKLPDGCSSVRAVIAFEPEGAMEKLGDLLGVTDRRVKGDLKRFKDFVEARSVETGAWRGEIHAGRVRE